MKLLDFVVQEAILPSMQVGSKESAIRTMVESLKEGGSIQAEDEENGSQQVGKLQQRVHLRFLPLSLLNIRSMRSVTRKPPTMFVVANATATMPKIAPAWL